MANLAWSELKKHDYRIDKFVSDIECGVPFEMESGPNKVLKFANPKGLANIKMKGMRAEKWAYTGGTTFFRDREPKTS